MNVAVQDFQIDGFPMRLAHLVNVSEANGVSTTKRTSHIDRPDVSLIIIDAIKIIILNGVRPIKSLKDCLTTS